MKWNVCEYVCMFVFHIVDSWLSHQRLSHISKRESSSSSSSLTKFRSYQILKWNIYSEHFSFSSSFFPLFWNMEHVIIFIFFLVFSSFFFFWRLYWNFSSFSLLLTIDDWWLTVLCTKLFLFFFLLLLMLLVNYRNTVIFEIFFSYFSFSIDKKKFVKAIFFLFVRFGIQSKSTLNEMKLYWMNGMSFADIERKGN